MIEYKAFELHTHTLHSDGSFQVSELCQSAKAYLYDGIALTDHNTTSGHYELSKADGLIAIPGIEWTTFYGHMLALNTSEYIDWRDVGLNDIDEGIKKLLGTGAVVGIAHPFHPGSPICTGCHWDYVIKDWSAVNYLEVWSKAFPNTLYINQLAFQMWTKLLNEGYKLAATSGRDWHGPDKSPVHSAVTYLGIEGDLTIHSAAQAIQQCRTYVTSGPAINLRLMKLGKEYGIGDTIGDTIYEGEASLQVEIDETARRSQWEAFKINTHSIRVVHNGLVLHDVVGKACCLSLELTKGWLRVEIYGSYMKNEEPVLLGFTSPVFIR